MSAEGPTVHYASRSHDLFGPLWVALSDRGLWCASYGIDELEFRARIQDRGPAQARYSQAPCDEALQQIDEYLGGRRRGFDLEIDWRGMTEFQVAVRKAVMAVPYGKTAAYSDIAADVGRPLAYRAVGSVQAANPLAFIIPCHRITHADGTLANYGGEGGVDTKTWLLELESAHLEARQARIY